MKKILALIVSWLPSTYVIRRYILAGSTFGDIESYSFMGQAGGYWWYWCRWNFWEAEIIRRGYQTISLDDFIMIGGYGAPEPILRKLAVGEEAIAHSKIRKVKVEQGDQLDADISFKEDGSFSGTYTLPSTEIEKQ